MEALIGWSILLVFVFVLVQVLRTAGPPGDARPRCGVADGGKLGKLRCH